MKYLIVGLGNVGKAYEGTRHNIGFDILDHLAAEHDVSFEHTRHAFLTKFKHRARIFCLIKPTTLVNKSGKAVNYWLQAEDIPLERSLIVVDDIALPLGTIRIKPKGSDGGHNGLKDINRVLGTGKYPRLRFGIGQDFPKGRQVDYVLGKWSPEQLKDIKPATEEAAKAILSFGTRGLQQTMTRFNS